MTLQETTQNLKDIKEYYTWDRDFSYYGDDYRGLTKEENEAIDMAIKTLEELPKRRKEAKRWKAKAMQHKQMWIPVSERLPTKEEYIANNGLFIVSDGNITYTDYFDVYNSMKFGEPTMHGFRVDRCVIAWLPLPEPYKAESEEV